jgi:hypothetical protein
MKLTKAQADVLNDLLNDVPLQGLEYRRVAVYNLIRMGLVLYNNDAVELTEKAKEIYC